MHVDAVEATATALMTARRALMRNEPAQARRALVYASNLIDKAQRGGRWDDTVSVFTLTATVLWNDLAQHPVNE